MEAEHRDLEVPDGGDVGDAPSRILLVVFLLGVGILVALGGTVVSATLAASGCGGG